MSDSTANASVLSVLADTLGDTTVLPTLDLGRDTTDSDRPLELSTARYVERDELGRGGLGVVLEAFDHDLRRVVALKRPIHPQHTASTLSNLVHEAQITAQLEHPNIPAVHSLGIDAEGRPFFTMTRLRGQSLSSLLAERKRDPEVRIHFGIPRLLRIVLQVGFALANAHARGVVHRDIKPDNIIIGDFGEVRLMDWGIARLRSVAEDPLEEQLPITTSDGRGQTRSGTFVGTPGYAAPEQVEGRPELDARADIYALGALLYEMLSGRTHVVGDSLMEVIQRTLAGDFPPLRSLVVVDERLAAVVHKALETDPEDRYPQVMDMLADIEALLEGRPVSAHEEGTLKRVGRWYLSRSPRIARLRTIEVDALAWGPLFMGVSLGLFLATVVSPHHVAYDLIAWVGLIVGVLFIIPPIYTMMRKPHPDDPGVLQGYTSLGPTTSTNPDSPGSP